MYLAKENIRIDSIGYLERTFVQQKLNLDFEDTSYKGIKHAGPLKVSVQTSFDYLMGSFFCSPSRSADLSRNCVVSYDFILSECFHNSYIRMVHFPWCLKLIISRVLNYFNLTKTRIYWIHCLEIQLLPNAIPMFIVEIYITRDGTTLWLGWSQDHPDLEKKNLYIII